MPVRAQAMVSTLSRRRNSAALVLLTIISLALTLIFAREISRFGHRLRSYGALGPVASALLLGLFGLTPLTTEPIGVLNGLVFGHWLGTFVNWVGFCLGSVAEYFLGRRAGEAIGLEERKKSLPLGLGNLPTSSLWFLFIGKTLPWISAKIVNLIAGSYAVPFRRFLWVTAITNLPGAFILGFAGHKLRLITHYLNLSLPPWLP
jgi:uncharacterized membrane protein YdjX (TVP38/TMEM64 family)